MTTPGYQVSIGSINLFISKTKPKIAPKVSSSKASRQEDIPHHVFVGFVRESLEQEHSDKIPNHEDKEDASEADSYQEEDSNADTRSILSVKEDKLVSSPEWYDPDLLHYDSSQRTTIYMADAQGQQKSPGHKIPAYDHYGNARAAQSPSGI